ncbi:hypothetical protein AB0K51_18895 [Kitasatospora sp. NPDC049285]|uniref:hypothetical protein n=1 Tax=Kitasatospora sp. NPDC049285 TaxID=3157096 RepID=UPI00343E06F9
MNDITALLEPPTAPRAPADRSHHEADPLPILPATPASEAKGRDWLARTSADPAACLAAWRLPHRLAPLRIAPGSSWHVISTDIRLGDGALQALGAANAAPGPTLLTETNILFWVPRLTVSWERLLSGVFDTPRGPWPWGTTLTAHLTADNDTVLPCPAPGSDARKSRWHHAPDGSGDLTYAGTLATALHHSFRALFAEAPAELAPRPPRSPRPPATADHFAAFAGWPHHKEAP